MVATLLAWRYDAAETLLGCGVDAEEIHRFTRFLDDPDRYALIFSAREHLHNRALGQPLDGYCASFCCKEAVFKALEKPFHFSECELFYTPQQVVQELCLSAEMRRSFGIRRAMVWVHRHVVTELSAVVHLFGAIEGNRAGQ